MKMNGDYYFHSGTELKGYCRFADNCGLIDVHVRHSKTGQYFFISDEPIYEVEKMNDEQYVLERLNIVGRYIAKYFLKVTVELE